MRSVETLLHSLVAVVEARRARADIVHFHGIGPALYAPLARSLGMRVVLRHGGREYDREKWGLLAKGVLRLGEAIGIRFADAVICISPEIACGISAVASRPVFVIPNGVAPAPATVGDATLTALGLEPQRYVLAVGRIVPEKNFHLLVEAFNETGTRGWKLVIVGAPDYPSQYGRRFAEVASSAGAITPGALSGLPLQELYCNAGLFVLPSTYEGHSFAALEALSHGLPVLLSDAIGNRSFALPEFGYFRVGDGAAGLAAALRRLLTDDQLRLALAARCRERATKFSVDRTASKTFAIFEHVAGRGRRTVRASETGFTAVQ
jgi:glycosyltransferase involved in cell wall biosynthesis